MKAAFIPTIYFIGCALIAPAYSLSCTTCSNCSASNTFVTVSQCITPDDVCVKMDFNDKAIFKQCGTRNQLCNATVFKQNWGNLYVDMKAAFTPVYVDGALLVNLNDHGRHVINCCDNVDNCNGALTVSLNKAVALGMMAMVYIVI